MSRRWPFFGAALALALGAIGLSGCVDRRFIIDSDPPGAVVYMNGKQIGVTPLEQPFTYYGMYRFVFVRDGFETWTVDEEVCAPWYEYVPLEFFAENVWPGMIRDLRYIPGRPAPQQTPPQPLQPVQLIPPDVIEKRGEQLRIQASGLGVPLAEQESVVIVPAPGPVPGPAPIMPAPPPAGAVAPVPVYPR